MRCEKRSPDVKNVHLDFSRLDDERLRDRARAFPEAIAEMAWRGLVYESRDNVPFRLTRRIQREHGGWCVEVQQRSVLRDAVAWLLCGLFCGMLFMATLLFGGQ